MATATTENRGRLWPVLFALLGSGAGASLVAASVAVRSARTRNIAAEVKEPEELSEQG